MNTIVATLPLLLGPASFGDLPPDRAPVRVTWQGRAYDAQDLPDDVPESARGAVRDWRQWAEDFDYRMHIEDQGRLVMVYPPARNPSRQMRLLTRTLDFLEPLIAAPVAETVDETLGETIAESRTTTTEIPECKVLVMTLGETYASAIGRVVAGNPYMRDFGRDALKLHGFAAQEPLVAVFRVDPDKTQEWEGNPDNELVNLVGQLAMLGRYGRQAYWVKAGWAWYTELSVTGSIYSFPYRDSYVGYGEHAGWGRALRAEFRRRQRRREPLTMEELGGLKRGTYDDPKAGLAWGTMTYLATFFPDALPNILDELGELWVEKGRVWVSADRWEMKSGFELSAEDQLGVFAKHTRPDFLEQLERFFREEDNYRLPRG